MPTNNAAQKEEWAIGPSVFTAYPSVGARLAEWKKDGKPIVRWPENAGANLAKVRGGNPILFPFAGRSFQESNEGQWSWQQQVLPMPRHGFARGGHFSATREEHGFTAVLKPTEEDQKAYPFDYRFAVSYQFQEDGFTVDFTLDNHSSAPIPWSAGHHFYFDLPVAQRPQASLKLSADKAWYHAADGQLRPVDTHLKETLFSEKGLVDRIHTHVTSQPVRFGPLQDDTMVSIRFEGDVESPEWVAVVAWTEAEDSPFYCVEPWMGPPNSPSHGHGLATVAPGATGRFRVFVSVA